MDRQTDGQMDVVTYRLLLQLGLKQNFSYRFASKWKFPLSQHLLYTSKSNL